MKKTLPLLLVRSSGRAKWNDAALLLVVVVVIVTYGLAGGWVEDQLAVVVLVVVEVELAIERAGDRVRRAIAQVPVVFNEAV